MKSQIKSITSQTKLHVYCIHGFVLHSEEASFVSLDDLDNISIFSEEENDLEEEITNLFNEVSNQSGSTYIQNMYRNFERFQVCFLV